MDGVRRRRFAPQKVRQVATADLIADGEHGEPLNDVLQFAHIAGPAIVAETRYQLWRQPEIRKVVLLFGFDEE